MTVGLVVAAAQTVALAVAAAVTGSVALKSQTATSLADVAASVFLLIGVLSSGRPADEHHPLGYGRERFFWSFLAAVGVFIGGFGAAVAETAHAWFHPEPTRSHLVGYLVLFVIVGLDAVALAVGLRPLLIRAAERHLGVSQVLWRGTDPAATTVVLTSAVGVSGGVIAAAGLGIAQLTGDPFADTMASAMIGLILLAASGILLHTNRELLTGRGLPTTEIARMRSVVGAQHGVLAVPDLFAVVVGPGAVIVDGDVVFDDDLDVPAVEAAIVAAAEALRILWPFVAYVYLNPVAAPRTRRSSDGPPNLQTTTQLTADNTGLGMTAERLYPEP